MAYNLCFFDVQSYKNVCITFCQLIGISVTRYDDGFGGCDGCLNLEVVGFRFDDAPNRFQYDNVIRTNNNGLGPTVEALEGLYTDASFPLNMAPPLNQSLQQTGI